MTKLAETDEVSTQACVVADPPVDLCDAIEPTAAAAARQDEPRTLPRPATGGEIVSIGLFMALVAGWFEV
ncbi:MAG: hypothetical protein ACC645_01440, partial [Pirellulales bacterium]